MNFINIPQRRDCGACINQEVVYDPKFLWGEEKMEPSFFSSDKDIPQLYPQDVPQPVGPIFQG